MKSLFCVFSLLMLVSVASFAQAPSPSPSPIVQASNNPLAAAPAEANVLVPDPAAPPQWAQDLIVSAQKLPIVGPIVAKIMLYAGIVSGILTLLVGFLLSAISLLSSVVSFAGLADFAEKLQEFKSGKIMYYLKYLSMFNAQKKVP